MPEHAHALLDAACAIAGRHGLAGLALRPLADQLGVSVSVLTHRHGTRADILNAICRAACAREAALPGEWRSLADAVGTPSADLAAELADAMFDDLAGRQRGLSLLFLELLHASTWDDSVRDLFRPWRAQRTAWWNDVAAWAGVPEALVACGWWQGYVIAELAHGLALDGQPWYRLLRRLCLRRLFAGGRAPHTATADAGLFEALQERLRQPPAGAHEADGWPRQAARACGMLLAERGVDALTHRVIAQQVGIPHTTLSYRFPTQRHLVLAGLQEVAAHIHSAVQGGSVEELQRMRLENDGARLDLARASFAVALAAARMPELAPYAADMRSRRGANLATVFHKILPHAPGIDALCTQVVSLGLTGVANAGPPGDESEEAVAAAFSAAARWLAPPP